VNHPPASFSGLVEYSRGESIRLGRGDRLNGTEIVCYTPTWRHKSLQVNLKVFEGGIGIHPGFVHVDVDDCTCTISEFRQIV
jgi:hypothetical protein